jgi:hypothetical protein
MLYRTNVKDEGREKELQPLGIIVLKLLLSSKERP